MESRLRVLCSPRTKRRSAILKPMVYGYQRLALVQASIAAYREHTSYECTLLATDKHNIHAGVLVDVCLSQNGHLVSTERVHTPHTNTGINKQSERRGNEWLPWEDTVPRFLQLLSSQTVQYRQALQKQLRLCKIGGLHHSVA